MRTISRLFAIASLATASLVCVAVASGDAASTYKGKCAMCHGADGKGDTGAGKSMGAHDFASAEVQKMTDAELTQAIAQGKGKMPAYGKSLKDAEIADLVAYIRDLARKK